MIAERNKIYRRCHCGHFELIPVKKNRKYITHKYINNRGKKCRQHCESKIFATSVIVCMLNGLILGQYSRTPASNLSRIISINKQQKQNTISKINFVVNYKVTPLCSLIVRCKLNRHFILLVTQLFSFYLPVVYYTVSAVQ